uniref:Uncharacterized protein n=1 Tax=Parascaris univalens TaxID=6257 RepID=A0A915BTM7_PARUN
MMATVVDACAKMQGLALERCDELKMLLTIDTKSGHDMTMRMLQYTIDPYSGWDPLHTRCDVLRISSHLRALSS